MTTATTWATATTPARVFGLGHKGRLEVGADADIAVVDLDAHLAVAARRLSGSAPAEDAAAHPLETRKAALDACRAAALRSLPLIRGAQNADARAAEALKACADGVAAWPIATRAHAVSSRLTDLSGSCRPEM